VRVGQRSSVLAQRPSMGIVRQGGVSRKGLAAGEAPADKAPRPTQQAVTPRPAPSVRPRRLPWADLLIRVFGVAALGHSMRVIAAITEPAIAKRILECVGLPPRAPPLEPAGTFGFASDPWREETEAGGFDQSLPDDWAPGA